MSNRSTIRNFVTRASAIRAEVAARVPAPATAERNLAMSFQPGDAAIDLVTGEKVIVDAGYEAADLSAPARPQLD